MFKSKNILSICLCIGILLAIVSIVGTTSVRSSGGKVSFQSVTIVSESGFRLAADIYRPVNATEDNPLPTVLVQHGGNNCKEEVEHYCLELSRRGNVAIAPDMYSMGDSQPLPDSLWLTSGRGLYDAVRYALTLPYVDKEHITLVGYSRGGKAAGEALELDNAGDKVISGIYAIYSDPIYRNEDGYTDVYGARDIGLIADKYDEFFFSEKANDTGVYSNDANKYAQNLSSPARFMENNSAQSFLYFGQDPTQFSEKRAEKTVYEQEYEDGKVGTRIITMTEETHMDGWFSPLIMEDMLKFMERTNPSGTSLAVTDFAYPANNIFSFIGIMGILIIIVSTALLFATRTTLFKEVNLGEPKLNKIPDKMGYLWFWGMQIVGFAVSLLIIWFLNKKGLSAFRDQIFRSANPIYFGLICILCGSFSLIMCVVWYYAYGKKHNFNLDEAGIFPSWKIIGKTAVVAVTTVLIAVITVFATSILFQTDYKFVYWGFVPFTSDRVPGMLLCLPLYLLYYTVISVSVNCFSYNNALGKYKIVNTLVMAVLTALPPLAIIGYVYGYFRSTGWNPMFGGLASAATAVYALPGIIFFAVIGSRLLYQKTGNPYLGGFINGIMVSVVSWMVCEIRVPEATSTYTSQPLVYSLIFFSFAVAFASAYILYKGRKTKKLSSK